MKSHEELAKMIEDCPDGGSVWHHYKGARYRVLAAAILESILEPMVVYCPADARSGPLVTFVRPLHEWNSMVDHNGTQMPRFMRVEV